MFMTPTLWYELVLCRLPLDDLVRARRVCKSFAQNPRLITLIKARIEAAFSGIERRHWNQTRAPRVTHLQTLDCINKYKDKFMCLMFHRRPEFGLLLQPQLDALIK